MTQTHLGHGRENHVLALQTRQNFTQDTKPVPLDPLFHLPQVDHANQADPRNNQPIKLHIPNYDILTED